jgi:hypothetical protein
VNNPEVGFGNLDDAEDLVFGGFGSSGASHGFHGSLGDSTEQGITFQESGHGFDQPISQHASLVSSATVGVSSFRDHNARVKLEQHQMLQHHPVTPLRDTPHTPTNQELPNHKSEPTTSYGGFKLQTGVPAPARPHLGVPSNVHLTAQQLAAAASENGAEAEGTELREFIAPGSLDTNSLLDQIQESIRTMQKQVDEMRESQTQTLQTLCENLVSETTNNSGHLTAMKTMIDFQTQCLEAAHATSGDLVNLLHTTILGAHEVERANLLNDELGLISATISLWQQELLVYTSWIQDGGEKPTLSQLTSLVIARAPFPSIWMKRNQMSEAEAIYARLLLGCTVTLSQFSEVQATIHCHTAYTAKTTPAKPIIDYDYFQMDPSTLTASCQFVFTAGSRKDVAQCRFSMTVSGSSFANNVLINRGNDVSAEETAQLVSPDSKPFIVITNECQYGETFGILFQKDVFHHQWGEARQDIPWPLFANSIQRYFIRSTRQDPVSPKRGLSIFDLEHIHAHFFASDPSIQVKPFSKFWDWFGKVLHRLRYQRHMSALWTEGLVFGMVSREGVYAQLITRPAGTFLLRFSESSAGFIAVGYRVSGANAGIKNYLVKQEDTASATVKTLPDFIRSRPEFATILQYTGQHLEDGFPVLYPIHKDYALKAYCAARPAKPVDPKAGSPYDEL